MRLLLALTAVAMLSVPLLSAQSTPAGPAPPPLKVLEDAAGDQDVTVGGQPTADSRWRGADLVGLTLQETALDYVLTLQVAGLGAENLYFVDIIDYSLGFVAKDQEHCLSVSYDPEGGRTFGSIGTFDTGFGFCDGRQAISVTVDTAASTLTLLVPRREVLDASSAPLYKPDTLHSFWAEAYSVGAALVDALTEGAAHARDRMPNDGVGTTPWPVQREPAYSGNIRALSPQPVRVSNGEATTFLFEVTLRNKAPASDVVVLSAVGAPESWVVTFPQKEVRMGQDSEMKVPVLVTVPFFHQHGVLFNFTVHAQSRSDPLSWGDVDLGVRYTAVPQPAGHHDTIYLHGDTNQYLNTLESEEIPAGEPATAPGGGSCSFSGGSNSGTSEIIPLVPGLDIGLDFDLARQGLARLTLNATAPVQETYSVGGYFVAWSGDDGPGTCLSQVPETAVASLERSAPLVIPANGRTTIELPITPLPYGDRVEYVPGIRFALILGFYEEGPAHVPICCLGIEAPKVEPGSSFRLPLNEYHDPVDQYFSALAGVDLLSDGAQQRMVNPGETAVFPLTIRNVGTGSAAFDLETTGTNLEWARILGDQAIRLGAGESRELGVAVAVPDGTVDGTLVDVTLHAVKDDDANVRSLIRLLAEVDTEADHPDDSAAAGELDKRLTGKKSPGAGLAAMLAVLAGALALALRRRD